MRKKTREKHAHTQKTLVKKIRDMMNKKVKNKESERGMMNCIWGDYAFHRKCLTLPFTAPSVRMSKMKKC